MEKCLRLACLFASVVVATRADELTITSFDATGHLTFDEVPWATMYRVEWASSLGEPWTSFADAAAALDAIAATGSGSVTCSVPMCYRVVAVVPPPPGGMVLIPPGVNSGTDPDAGAYSLTNGLGFYMDRYEVTKTKWDSVASWANGHGYDIAPSDGLGKASGHPVQHVTWYETVKWCNARSQQSLRTPCYTVGGFVYKTGINQPDCDFGANGYRLPSQEEWEYAARGGVSSERFPWAGGRISHTNANYNAFTNEPYCDSYPAGFHPDYDDATPYTSPVGVFDAGTNRYGLYDMAGNVWEWCWDLAAATNRVIRSGCWLGGSDACRIVTGMRVDPGGVGGDTLGFRTVCTLDQ